MKTRLILIPLLLGVSSFALSSCNSREKQAEIVKLNEELELTRKSIKKEKRKADSEREENRDLVDENNQLQRDLRDLEGRATAAEREVARFKKRESKAKEVAEREPSSREKQKAAQKTVVEHLPAIVTIGGDQSSGFGTLVSADDKTWIYFPPDAVTGSTRLEIKTSDGTKLEKFGSFEIASDANLARLELKGEVNVSLTPSATTAIESGFPILEVGDSNAILKGRASDVTPGKLGGGSRFSRSAIGSPVFSGETAELLGILVTPANHNRTLWPQPARSRSRADNTLEVCRLDRSIKWNPLPIAALIEEGKKLSEADRLTRLVLAFAATNPSTSGVTLGSPAGGSATTQEIFENNKTVASVKSLFALDEWLKEKGARVAKADVTRRISGVYADVLRISKRSTKALTSTKFSSYHTKAAAQSIEWRKEAEKKLGEVSKSFN